MTDLVREEQPQEDEPQEVPSGVEEVIKELERIAQDDPDGLIEPEAVVEAASDELSPLHQHFQWDDTEAGHEWRLHQARNLIRSIRIIKMDPGPRFVNVTITRVEGNARRGYVQTERAVADPDMFDQVIEDTMKLIRSLNARLSAFEQARSATRTMKKALKELESLKKERNQNGN